MLLHKQQNELRLDINTKHSKTTIASKTSKQTTSSFFMHKLHSLSLPLYRDAPTNTTPLKQRPLELRSAAAAVQGVGVEDGEQDEDDGCDEGDESGGADVAAEFGIDTANLVPPGV
jgi:hypothetical protein